MTIGSIYGVNTQKVRNIEIWRARKNGATFRAIGASFNLSGSYVAIVYRAMEIEDQRQDALNEAAENINDAPLDVITMSTRLRNCLRNVGARTVGQMLDLDDGEASKVPNIGRATLAELCAIKRRYSDAGSPQRDWLYI